MANKSRPIQRTKQRQQAHVILYEHYLFALAHLVFYSYYASFLASSQGTFLRDKERRVTKSASLWAGTLPAACRAIYHALYLLHDNNNYY